MDLTHRPVGRQVFQLSPFITSINPTARVPSQAAQILAAACSLPHLFNPHPLITPPQWKVSLSSVLLRAARAPLTPPNSSLSSSPPSPSHLHRAFADHFSRLQRRSQLSSSTMGKNHRRPRLPPSLPVRLHVMRHSAAIDTISQQRPAQWRANSKLQSRRS